MQINDNYESGIWDLPLESQKWHEINEIWYFLPDPIHNLDSGARLSAYVGDEVVTSVDLPDLSAYTVVFYADRRKELASVILPETIASRADDEQ